MRSKHAPGDQRLEKALADLANALNAARVAWMVIGGIAVIARGVRRMTTDIDAAVRGDQCEIASLLRALAKHQIVARIDDAERFASESLVLLLKHESTGVEFDVSMAWTDFEHEAIASSSVANFGTVKAPMARPEDLIVFKTIAGRPKDIEDATALFVLYPKLDRRRIRERVKQLAALADQPELAAGLETAIATSAIKPERVRERKTRPETSSRIKRPSARATVKPKKRR